MPAAKGTVPWNAGAGKGWTDKRGYRWVYVTENGRQLRRREHRVFIEQHLGRKLEPWEIVHHKDGNPSNNALENLEVMEFGAHTAQHSQGARKSYDAKRSMEAFALLREELKAERRVKADLLAALEGLLADIQDYQRINNLGGENNHWQVIARAAIAKATGAA